MDMSMENLKCSVCGYPLSIAPIYYNASLGSVCGRCENIRHEQSGKIFERQFLFEKMVKNIFFPCAFRREGCLAKIKGDDVSNHEQICSFKVTTEVRVPKKPSELAELTTLVLQTLECPVCTELMGPPIHLCSVGHNICSRCRYKILECPICREGLTKTRNLTLENICSIITSSCINRKNGCSYIDTISKVKKHEPFCGLQEIRCIIKACHWVERMFQLSKHLKEKHKFKEIGKSYPYKIGSKFEQHMFIFDEKFFLVTLRSEKESIHCSIHGLGEKQFQYEYELLLIDPTVTISELVFRDFRRSIGYNFIDDSIVTHFIPMEMCSWVVEGSDQINFMINIQKIFD